MLQKKKDMNGIKAFWSRQTRKFGIALNELSTLKIKNRIRRGKNNDIEQYKRKFVDKPRSKFMNEELKRPRYINQSKS